MFHCFTGMYFVRNNPQRLTNMNKLTGLIFVFGSFLSLAQSKQEIIDMLNLRIDSLKRVNFEQELTLKKVTYDKDELQKKATLEQNQQLNTIQLLERKLSQLAYLSSLDAAEEKRLYQQIDSLNNTIVQLKSKSIRPLQAAKMDSIVQSFEVYESAPANFYISVRIGTQQWMTQNLNVFTFSNGDTLPQALSLEEWENAYANKKAMWCYPNFDTTSTNKSTKLYNWFALQDERGLAPNGWHISTEEDWKKLQQFAGPTIGQTIKSTNGWNDFEQQVLCPHSVSEDSINSCNLCKGTGFVSSGLKSGNGTNQLGFNAVPLSYLSDKHFLGAGDQLAYWMKTNTNEKAIIIHHFSSELHLHELPLKAQGFAIRCLKN